MAVDWIAPCSRLAAEVKTRQGGRLPAEKQATLHYGVGKLPTDVVLCLSSEALITCPRTVMETKCNGPLFPAGPIYKGFESQCSTGLRMRCDFTRTSGLFASKHSTSVGQIDCFTAQSVLRPLEPRGRTA